jgi:hypothetical protein
MQNIIILAAVIGGKKFGKAVKEWLDD